MGDVASKKKILIVDDDVDFRASVTAVLEAQGYAVSNAANGKEGLEKSVTESPDLIILDIMMEYDSAGYEVNQAIKFCDEFKAVRNVPILMVSSIQADPQARFPMATELDMIRPDGYQTKPLDILQFLAEVRTLLGEKG